MTEMKRILALVEIGGAAVETDRVREACTEAKAKRESYTYCEHEQHWPGPPCWKRYVVVTHGYDDDEPYEEQERLDVTEWCDNCLKRQVAHKSYVVLRNKLGGMRAGLARRCTHYRKGGE